MTNEMMALQGLLEKTSDADLLREMLGFADHPIKRIDELLPWRWRPTGQAQVSTEKAA
jgi:hypothetical protein